MANDDFFTTEGEKKGPSNPAEQNQELNMPEKTPQQNLVDQMSVGMKPPRSDSSSETFVADKTEALRHEQVQRIQEGTVQSTDAPNDQVRGEGGTNVVLGGIGDPNKRNAANPGGLEDLSPEGIAQSTETSQVRQLGVSADSQPSEYFETYMAGRKVTVKEEDMEEYRRLLDEVERARRGRLMDNIPVGDPYHIKVQELNRFTAGF